MVITLFKNLMSFIEFKSFLKENLLKFFASYPHVYTLIEHSEVIYKVYITDLTPVRDFLAESYHPRGEKPWDPVCLFRSYWLMCQYGYQESISHWVTTLQNPFWAIVSGFTPGDIPGVGTFYDFEDRLLDFDKGQRVERKNHLRPSHSKPKDNLKQNEKKPPKHSGIVQRLVDRILRDEDKKQPTKPDDILHSIFKDCFVLESARRDLLGDTDNISVSGDGIIFGTGSSPFGIKECDCWKRGIYTCGCPRRYSDPDANWGWDSYREKYVFGYSNYTFTAADSINNLPLFSTIAQASRHDSVTHTYSLYRMLNLYPEFNFSADILDSAHDNYATYDLLEHWDIEPFIALNDKRKGNRKYDPPLEINDYGIPICKGGFLMCHDGYCKGRSRIKWRCPHVRNKVECPIFNCSKSDYGRTIYTKPEWDKRIFTSTPRDSKKWKNTMKKRTTSERRNKRVKIDYQLEDDKVRSKSRWLIRTVMRDAALHVDAWIKQDDINLDKWIFSWLGIDLNRVA